MVNPAERHIIYDAEGNEIDVTNLYRVDDPKFRLKFKNFLNAQIVDEFKQVNNWGGLRHLPVAHWDSQSPDIARNKFKSE